jgi:hypothetical protein
MYSIVSEPRRPPTPRSTGHLGSRPCAGDLTRRCTSRKAVRVRRPERPCS